MGEKTVFNAISVKIFTLKTYNFFRLTSLKYVKVFLILVFVHSLCM